MKTYYREDHIEVYTNYNNYNQYFLQDIFFNQIYKVIPKNVFRYPFVFYTYDVYKVLKELKL